MRARWLIPAVAILAVLLIEAPSLVRPAGETYVAVESPRGELGCYLVSDGGANPYRMHTRAPSFSNLQALPITMADSLMADTVATIASLDPVMGDVDR